jgi:hypothetical protein
LPRDSIHQRIALTKQRNTYLVFYSNKSNSYGRKCFYYNLITTYHIYIYIYIMISVRYYKLKETFVCVCICCFYYIKLILSTLYFGSHRVLALRISYPSSSWSMWSTSTPSSSVEWLEPFLLTADRDCTTLSLPHSFRYSKVMEEILWLSKTDGGAP